MLEKIIDGFSNALYSYILIILLVGGGIYFTVKSKFFQFRSFKEQIKSVVEKPSDKDGVSSFQALMVSTASRVGTGNIVGVATAICLGGFGSVFWMWIIAIIGMASALIESTLAQIYKKRGLTGCYGGPAYYIEATFKSRIPAVIFSILLILTYGVGFNMLASYNLQATFATYDFYVPNVTCWIIGGIIAVFVAICLFGGGKGIIKTTSFLVPIMGVAYVLVSIIVVLINITNLPSVFVTIFKEAFDFKAIFGGLSGSCLMYGIKRGLFSNEAGVGSAPNASASAEVSHPVKQGLVQMLSVFIDTIVICSATAFMCMTSGATSGPDVEGATYVQNALQSSLGAFGPIFITISMMLFAFTTLLGNLFYVDKALAYILKKEPSKTFKCVYYVIASLLVFLGAGLSSSLLWNLADVFMGLMAVINIPTILALSKYVFRAVKDYGEQKKAGKTPTFIAKSIGLDAELDYWQEEDAALALDKVEINEEI